MTRLLCPDCSGLGDHNDPDEYGEPTSCTACGGEGEVVDEAQP